jgi:hypothetical protein
MFPAARAPLKWHSGGREAFIQSMKLALRGALFRFSGGGTDCKNTLSHGFFDHRRRQDVSGCDLSVD